MRGDWGGRPGRATAERRNEAGDHRTEWGWARLSRRVTQEVPFRGCPTHRVVRHRDLVDPVRGHHGSLEGPVRDGHDPLRRAAPGPARRPRGASDQRPVPRGQRAAGVHRGRGRPDRQGRASRPGSHRGDDGARRARGDAVPRGPSARHPAGARGRAHVGALRPDHRRPDGPADPQTDPAQALRPVLAVDRMDDARPDDQHRRLVEPRGRRRQPVPAPLDLRPRGDAGREVGNDRLRHLVQPLVR